MAVCNFLAELGGELQIWRERRKNQPPSERIKGQGNHHVVSGLQAFEILNSLVLLGVIIAQTFGLYETCNCQASTWGGKPVSKPVNCCLYTEFSLFRDTLTLKSTPIILSMGWSITGN